MEMDGWEPLMVGWEPLMGGWEPKSSLHLFVTRLRRYAYVIVCSITPYI